MSEKVELQKNLGLLNCVNLIVGIIIGSGIFISPKGVVQEVDSVGLSLVVWIATGIFSMFGAMAYSELGAMIPKAGGEYEYLMVAFGPLYGFLFVWSFVIIIIPASFALSALTFADYILKPIYDTCDAPLSVRLLLGAVSIMFVMFINCWSVKVTNAVQNVFTVAKIAGLLIIIGLGIYSLSMGKFDNFQNAFEGSNTNPGKIALAFYAGLYSYSGWSYLNYVVEEIKNPQKVLPLAITIGLGIVIVIYVFANFAYFTLLTPREMVGSSAVAFTFCEKIMGKYSVIIAIFVALSSLGYVNGGLFSASRTMFGAARNSHMPTILSLINIKFLTPMISIIFLSAFSLICCFIEDTFVLLKMTMLTEYIFIGATVGGLLWLRKKNPDAERPIKINIFFPVTFLVLCILMVVMTVIISPQDSILCLIIIALGIPVYLIFIKIEKPESIQRKIANFNIAVQKLTYSVFDESKQE